MVYFFAAINVAAINIAKAAPPVDAGTIQRDIERLNKPNLPPVPSNQELQPNDQPADNNATVTVKQFQFVGATLLTDAALQAEVASYIGQTLNFNQLNAVARKISQLYQKNGWLAKVFLPPQDIANGFVTIEINEAKLGDVRTNTQLNARLNPNLATNILAKNQQKGAPLSSKNLERAMLLINDTPGFAAQATLSAGAQTGETDITVNLTDAALFNAYIWVDNYGSRLLGKARLNGQVSFNNLSGWGDQVNVQALVSRGLEYVKGDIDVPVGNDGTRFNLAGALTNYEVVRGAAKTLNPQGESYSIRTNLRHPIIRNRFSNLSVYTNLEALNSQDELLGLEISDKSYRILSVGLKGDSSDNYSLGIGQGSGFGGGTFWGGISLTTGHLDLNNRDELAADKLTTRSDGSYNKLNFYLGRQQILTENISTKVLFSGQLSDSNLGGFEKFTLGGPAGVQGFTVGEAAADQGWLLNTEVRYAITPQFSASVLADAGGVCQFKNTWAAWNAGNPKLENCYQLASAGFGLGYAHQLFDARLSYGRRLSSNRGEDVNGNDSEGENNKHQLWLQVSTRF